MDDPKPALLFVEDLDAEADVFHAMLGAGLQIEGVVAKRSSPCIVYAGWRAASTYQAGLRSSDWVKIKRPGWQEGREWRS